MNLKDKALFYFILLFILFSPVQSKAETPSHPPDTGYSNTQQQRLLEPLPELRKDKGEPEIKLPQLPKDENISSKVTVFVKTIRIQQSTVFTKEQLESITKDYTGREISFMELETLRSALTQYYISHGFINSGVIIPDQKVENGEIILIAVEGKLTDIEVTGNKYFSSEYIKGKLRLYSGTPLDINDLQKALQIMLQNPMIQRLNAELAPGLKPGESVLTVKIEESSPFTLIVEGSNDHSPSIGSYGGDVYALYRNLTGHGDTIGGSFSYTKGLKDGTIEYAIPLDVRDTTLRVYYRQNEANVIEDPFKRLDIESKVKTYGVALSHPIYKTPETEFALALAVERKHSETFLLGRRFSFSEGTDDGKAGVFVVRFFQEWSTRSRTQVLAARSTISLGLKGFNSTTNDDAADGRFVTWLLQFQWIKRLFGTSSQIVFRTDAQFSNDSLLPLEKFAIGGMNSVRGYRKNIMVRDNGIFSSLEFRIPIYGTEKRPEILQIVPFTDYGRSWNTRSTTPLPRDIYSAGLGLRWAVTKKILFQIYGAKGFVNLYNYDEDYQDKGIYFKLTTQVF
ncbi:MAG: BamA/TamA family outer membrane protein [Nitrospirae bacterium YQR-1]